MTPGLHGWAGSATAFGGDFVNIIKIRLIAPLTRE
jgi:hypothetical protein